MTPYLTTDDLAVGYHGQALIRDICLSIGRGEIVCLIGPNGAGKSTILKSLTRQIKALSGRVVLDGSDVSELSGRALARRAAAVFPEAVRTELLTCLDVVSLGRYPYTGRLGLLSDGDRRTARAAMEQVGVWELAQRDIRAISDGQRQLVLLARALCQQPELLVLDEPTSFLDIRHKLRLLDMLRALARRGDMAVLLSLHEIELAQKLADRLVCVRGERIFALGTPEEIFRPAVLEPLYDLEEGRYDCLFGSLELPRPQGEPHCFVLAGGGSGVAAYRALHRRGVPFAAGVLHENDAECQLARSLAAHVVTQRPFYPIEQPAFLSAQRWIERCGQVLYTDFPTGPMNARQTQLLQWAKAQGIPCRRHGAKESATT